MVSHKVLLPNAYTVTLKHVAIATERAERLAARFSAHTDNASQMMLTYAEIVHFSHRENSPRLTLY
jgi:hypothetical protein